MEDSHLLPAEIRKIQEDTQKIEDSLFKKEPEKTPEQIAEEQKAAKEKEEAEKAAAEASKRSEGGEEGEILSGEEKAEAERKAAEEIEAAKKKEEEEAARIAEEAGKPVNWEHKYKVMSGKYNKELPRERDARKTAEDRAITVEYENSELRKQVTQLNERIGNLETGKSTKADLKPEESSKAVTAILDELESDADVQEIKREFPDFWKANKKALNKIADVILRGASEKVTKIEKHFESSKEETRKSNWIAFHKYLDENVVGWRTVNKDPIFETFLEEKIYGVSKRQLIDKAIDEMNGPEVAKFFVEFAKSKEPPPVKKREGEEENAGKDKGGQPPKPADTTNPPKGQKTTPPKRPEDKNKEIITSEHISKFYDDKRRGLYQGREAEAMAEEKRIEKAVAEGRVR